MDIMKGLIILALIFAVWSLVLAHIASTTNNDES